jgi:methionine biosynthesis protein MetW
MKTNTALVYNPEYKIIVGMVESGSSVLDLGCGNGDLLAILKKERGIVRSQGIEIDEKAIYECVAKGVSVFHGDIDSGLSEYSDKSFDYVILNQTFQQVKKPDVVLAEALRVGGKVIVGFPNFAYLTARFHLGIRGRAPITKSLPYKWFNTPNIHFLSIADFWDYCKNREIKIEKANYQNNSKPVRFMPNIFALLGVFLISKNEITKSNPR